MNAIHRFRRLSVPARISLTIGVLSALWTLWVILFGGVDESILGLRFRSTNWTRPAVLAAASLLVFAWLRPRAIPNLILRGREILAAALPPMADT